MDFSGTVGTTPKLILTTRGERGRKNNTDQAFWGELVNKGAGSIFITKQPAGQTPAQVPSASTFEIPAGATYNLDGLIDYEIRAWAPATTAYYLEFSSGSAA